MTHLCHHQLLSNICVTLEGSRNIQSRDIFPFQHSRAIVLVLHCIDTSAIFLPSFHSTYVPLLQPLTSVFSLSDPSYCRHVWLGRLDSSISFSCSSFAFILVWSSRQDLCEISRLRRYCKNRRVLCSSHSSTSTVKYDVQIS